MSGEEDAFVYDEASGEWISGAEAAAKAGGEGAVEVRDASRALVLRRVRAEALRSGLSAA
jgi:hypothetical protein